MYFFQRNGLQLLDSNICYSKFQKADNLGKEAWGTCFQNQNGKITLILL